MIAQVRFIMELHGYPKLAIPANFQGEATRRQFLTQPVHQSERDAIADGIRRLKAAWPRHSATERALMGLSGTPKVGFSHLAFPQYFAAGLLAASVRRPTNVPAGKRHFWDWVFAISLLGISASETGFGRTLNEGDNMRGFPWANKPYWKDPSTAVPAALWKLKYNPYIRNTYNSNSYGNKKVPLDSSAIKAGEADCLKYYGRFPIQNTWFHSYRKGERLIERIAPGELAYYVRFLLTTWRESLGQKWVAPAQFEKNPITSLNLADLNYVTYDLPLGICMGISHYHRFPSGTVDEPGAPVPQDSDDAQAGPGIIKLVKNLLHIHGFRPDRVNFLPAPDNYASKYSVVYARIAALLKEASA